MKRFDKFLNKLFHSKIGICSMVVSIFMSLMVMSGCFVFDLAACFCDTFLCGSGTLFAECSDLIDSSFGCGRCVKYRSSGRCGSLLACGTWTCGSGTSSDYNNYNQSSSGCNSGGSGSGSGKTSSIYDLFDYYTVTLKMEAINKSVSISVRSNETVNNNSSIFSYNETVNEYKRYFDFDGFYSSKGKMVVDSNGNVVDKSYFKDKSSFTLYANGVEKGFDTEVTINFESGIQGVKFSTVKVIVGGTIDVWTTCNNGGVRVRGWKLKDGDDTIMNVEEGKTVFHYYLLNASIENELTLVPVYDL